MKNVKNNLDEMQEAKLLQIEHNGCWLAFWGLLAAIVVELFVFGVENMRYIIGEWVVFLALCVYMAEGCLRNGIWDRRLKADPKTNLIVSLIGGLVAGIFSCIPVFRNFGATPGLLTLVMAFLFAAGLCFVALSLSASAYKKRVSKLEHEAEAEEN